MPKSRGVYLLHFDSAIADHAQHYLGYAANIDARLAQHAAGQGARLTAVCKERHVSFVLARMWPNASRTDERRLKNRHNGPRLCPICHAAQRVTALARAVEAAEPERLATFDAYLRTDTAAARRAWTQARDHSARLRSRLDEAYAAWTRLQPPDHRCARCGVFALGTLCAQCAEGSTA